MKNTFFLLLAFGLFACNIGEPTHYNCDQHGDLVLLFRKDSPQDEFKQPLWLCDNCTCDDRGPTGPTGVH